jgi:hypothetical protein
VVKKNGIEKADITKDFFDYDKAYITNEASIELDKVVL